MDREAIDMPNSIESLKEKLTANRIQGKTDTITIEGVGTITVRGLTRHEFIIGQRLSDDMMKQERYLLSRCMVDPQMNEDDVAAWQKASGPGEINQVSLLVNRLSGIAQGADKSSVPEVRD